MRKTISSLERDVNHDYDSECGGRKYGIYKNGKNRIVREQALLGYHEFWYFYP